MDMTAIGAALRRQRAVVVLVFMFFIGATVALVYITDNRYTSTTTLYIQPTTVGTATSSVNDVEFVMPALEAVVSAAPTRAAVQDELPASVVDSEWRVDGTADPGTGLMRISVTSPDPAVPPVVADAFTPVLRNYAAETTTPVAVTVIEPAGAPDSDRAVRIISIVVAGLLIASITAVLLALLFDRLRREP